MPEYHVKACDQCKIGKKIGDKFSVDIKNINDNWEHNAPCDICHKYAYQWVFKVGLLEKIGDIMKLEILGMMKKE
jgi:hypothetical protein